MPVIPATKVLADCRTGRLSRIEEVEKLRSLINSRRLRTVLRLEGFQQAYGGERRFVRGRIRNRCSPSKPANAITAKTKLEERSGTDGVLVVKATHSSNPPLVGYGLLPAKK